MDVWTEPSLLQGGGLLGGDWGRRVQGSGFRVKGLGFRVQGLGLVASTLSSLKSCPAATLLQHRLHEVREHGGKDKEQVEVSEVAGPLNRSVTHLRDQDSGLRVTTQKHPHGLGFRV